MMEQCVEIIPFNASKLVRIKQPGAVRDRQGRPSTSIQMTISEAIELVGQINLKIAEQQDTNDR